MLNENAKKWVKALKSAKYKQAKSQLGDKAGYCCLGVACVIAKKEGVIKAFGSENTHLPEEVRRWLGLTSASGEYYVGDRKTWLVDDNDNRDKNFKEIAAIIESEPAGLFES